MANTLNIGIVAHIDAGKTTLTENILYESGVIRTKGRVDHASSVTDDLEVERRRGITIREKTVSFNWEGIKINLLDTPGHADFIGEVLRAFHVLDTAVLVISAKESVQPQTVAIYKLLTDIGLPVAVFINKLDRIGADTERVRKDLASLGAKPVIMRFADENMSVRHWSENTGYTEDNLLTLSEFEDDIISRYESGQTIDDTVYKLTAEAKILPVFMGAALHGIGVKDLLDGLVNINRHISVPPGDAASAVVYKINFNERRERKIYFRMYSGTIRLREKYKTSQKPDGGEIQIKTLETISGAKLTAADCVSAGEIGVLTNTDGLKTGDIIGEHCKGIRTVDGVKPIFSAGIHPIKRADRRRLLEALSEMDLEDGQLDFAVSESQITLKLFGEIQKEFILTQLCDKYGIEAEFEEAKVIFKETPVGHGMADTGTMAFAVEPLPMGTGVRYQYNRSAGITGGNLNQSMRAAIKEGALASLVPGALTIVDNGVAKPFYTGAHGWEVTDIQVIFNSCGENVKSSGAGRISPSALKFEAAYALRYAIQNAGTRLLEPVYYYEAVVREDLCGKTAIEIENHLGSVVSMENAGDYITLSGRLPARMYQSFLHKFQYITKNMSSFDIAETAYEPYDG